MKKLSFFHTPFSVPYYNIPSNNRELQRGSCSQIVCRYYNIPSNNRELQLNSFSASVTSDYNIPSNNRELQPSTLKVSMSFIITYQVITGNYS